MNQTKKITKEVEDEKQENRMQMEKKKDIEHELHIKKS